MKKLTFLIFVLFLPTVSALSFNAWVEGPSSLTVGRKEMINIYIKNKADFLDNYTITVWRNATKNGNENPSLIDVRLGSKRVVLVKPNETRTTFAVFSVLTKIDRGSISFNITSDSGDFIEVDPALEFGEESVQTPVNLEEFSISKLLCAVESVISYTSHLGYHLLQVLQPLYYHLVLSL